MQVIGEFQSARKVNLILSKITYTHYVRLQCQQASFLPLFVHLVFKENSMELVGVTNRNLNCNSCMFRSKFINCKFMFRVVLNVNEHIIRSYIMTHKHACSKSLMRCDLWFRRLSGKEERNIGPVLQRLTSSTEIMERVRNTYHNELIASDLRNVESKVTIGGSSKF